MRVDKFIDKTKRVSVQLGHSVFTVDVLQIIDEAGVGVQQYADYTQAYQHCKPNDAVRAFTQQTTLTKVQAWMSSNRLKLNPSKTQYIWFGTRVQLAKIDKQELLQQFLGVVFHSSVVDLGVLIDEELKMDSHVGSMVCSCFHQLRQIRTVTMLHELSSSHSLSLG